MFLRNVLKLVFKSNERRLRLHNGGCLNITCVRHFRVGLSTEPQDVVCLDRIDKVCTHCVPIPALSVEISYHITAYKSSLFNCLETGGKSIADRMFSPQLLFKTFFALISINALRM